MSPATPMIQSEASSSGEITGAGAVAGAILGVMVSSLPMFVTACPGSNIALAIATVSYLLLVPVVAMTAALVGHAAEARFRRMEAQIVCRMAGFYI